MSLKNNLRASYTVAKEAGLWTGVRWFGALQSGISKEIQIRLRGRNITLRTGTPDLEVAMSCFDGEFDQLLEAAPGPKHGLVIDAGGYIGTAAIVLAEARPDAVVIVLEPSKANYEILKKNVAAYPNIQPVNAALAPEVGTLQLRDRGTGNWGFTLVSVPEDNPNALVIDEVKTIPVGQLLRESNRDGIDIFKIDIEGGEHALLSRNTDWIAKTDAICIELHDRIISGCSDVYSAAVMGRINSKMDGEKYLSVAR
jgi:FkbM family methyltransferase